MRVLFTTLIAILTLGLCYGPVVAQTNAGDFPVLSSFHMLDALTGWAGTRGGELLRTVDGGTQWKAVSPLNFQRRPVGWYATAVTPLIAWVASSGPSLARTTYTHTQIFRTVDGGRTWRYMIAPGGVKGMHFVNARDGWFLSMEYAYGGAVEVGDIYHSTDGGETWNKVATAREHDEKSGLPFIGYKNGITFVDAMTGWIYGVIGEYNWLYLYVTHDGGRTWQAQPALLPPLQAKSPWTNVTGSPVFFTPRDGIIPVYYSTFDPLDPVPRKARASILVIYVTHDTGRTWAYTTPLPIKSIWNPLSFADMKHGWVLDEDDLKLYATNDGGHRWTAIRSNPPLAFGTHQLEFISPQVGWAVRSFGFAETAASPSLLKTLDGGHTWAPVIYTISRQ